MQLNCICAPVFRTPLAARVEKQRLLPGRWASITKNSATLRGLIMRCRHILVGLLMLTQGVSAEPTRDQVMAGAARCTGIGDNRAWLDCFYGSAQPMRALLALPPAPLAQTKLVPPPGALYSARDANRSAERHSSTGFFGDILGSSKPAESNVPMASYKFARDGTFTVVLKSGQTYRQEESDVVFAKWNKAAGTYLVTVIGTADLFILEVQGERGVRYHARRL